LEIMILTFGSNRDVFLHVPYPLGFILTQKDSKNEKMN